MPATIEHVRRLGLSPLVVFYEFTRACDLAFRHYRDCAQPRRHPHDHARHLIDQLTVGSHADASYLLLLQQRDPARASRVQRRFQGKGNLGV